MHRRWKATSRSCFDVFLPKRRKRASRDVLKYFYLSILHTQNGFLQTFGVSGPQGPGTSILQTVALLLQIPIPQHKKTAGRCFTPRCLWRKVRNYCLRMCFFQSEQKGCRLCTFKCEDEGVYSGVNDRSPRHEERAQDAPLSSLWRKVRGRCFRMCFFQIRCACGSHPRSTANRHGKKPCLFAGGALVT